MDLELSGNVAVVVGGASGIGRAIAGGFASEGAAVALVDIASDVEEQAVRLGGAAAGWQADVADYESLACLPDKILDRFGRLDHLMYAAGIGSGQYGFPFWDVEPAVWSRTLEVNLIGCMHAAHAFAPRLASQRRGTMLFLSSVAGQIGSQTDPPYSAAKAGVINFAQCAAKDLAPYGVRVNCLCPGMVQTPLNRSVWQAWAEKQPEDARLSYDEWTAEKILRVVPLGRWQTPEDLAATALFLASDRARNVTGQTINVDGGFVMHW